jgi:hypothetical protein
MTDARLSFRVPTLAPILEGAARGLRRTPLTIVAGAVATVAAIVLVEEIGDEDVLQGVLCSAVLGISLFTGLRLLGERYRWRPVTVGIVDLGGLVVLAGFYAAWGQWSEPARFARFAQLLAAFHLFVAVAPYVTGPEGRGFWAYNRALFERVVVAALYALVLFAGAAIALLALDNLFGVDVAPRAYARLWFVAGLFLMPWFFVAGLPADREALERQDDYPRDLRAFTRFALLPIVALYLLILLVYFGKVLATWQWPSGWIGWLVSAVAVGGIFSLLLVHPLADRPGDRWVGTYARAFYLLLLPAIVMLWLAIWQRVDQYGITERRYFLIGLSVWLAGIAVYQLVTRARGIRIIPMSLGLVGLLTFAGPWGAYAISEGSQVRRLGGLLERNGMLSDGTVRPTSTAVPAEDRREISATLRYLAGTHDLDAVAPWFGGRLAEIDTVARDSDLSAVAGERARVISTWLGIEYVPEWQAARSQWFSYGADLGDAGLAVAPYDSLLFVRSGLVTARPGLRAQAGAGNRSVDVYGDGMLIGRLPLDSLLVGLRANPAGTERNAPVPAERLRMTRDSAGLRLTLQLLTIGGSWEGDSLTVRELRGVVLVGVQKAE